MAKFSFFFSAFRTFLTMNTQLQLLDRSLDLVRWPLAQKNRSLQAWDSADEYLINHIESNQLINQNSRVLIINDSFGALSCWFGDNQRFSIVDSYVSEQGIRHNCQQNLTDVQQQNLTIMPSNTQQFESADLVIIKVPKNNGYLEETLAKISQSIAADTKVIAAGKTTDIHKSTLALFEKYLGPTSTSLAKKKSRLIFSSKTNKDVKQSPYPIHWSLKSCNLTIVNYANVFSRDSLDIGARLLLENLPNPAKKDNNQTIIDLGCGNGVLGLTMMKLFSPSMVKFVDESYMAVASAQASCELNFPQNNHCQFVIDDCLTQQADASADIVLCNPPFHQQQAVTDHIAWQMFKDAFRVLKPGGQLRIVGNRNLGYHIKLKRLFANCEQIASNKKFVVLAAYK